MQIFTSRLSLVLAFIVILVMLAMNTWYRWDVRLLAPTAYLIASETDWYSEKSVLLEDVTKKTPMHFEASLKRQGFRTASSADRIDGYQTKSDGVYWYLFKVDRDDTIYTKEYSIASGLCSQTVGVLISESSKEIRLLNPGGSCV